MSYQGKVYSFNPCTREGCDSGQTDNNQIHDCFNPRTREGCDRGRRRLIYVQGGFNPRTREGCDPLYQRHSIRHQVFQSTHPRGVRLGDVLGVDPDGDVSIHAPARGAT